MVGTRIVELMNASVVVGTRSSTVEVAEKCHRMVEVNKCVVVDTCDVVEVMNALEMVEVYEKMMNVWAVAGTCESIEEAETRRSMEVVMEKGMEGADTCRHGD